MWMTAPIPETSTSIIRLKRSSTKPNGTVKAPGKLIQVKLTADVAPRANIMHAPTKLTITAAQDKKLLNGFERRVNSVINTAAPSGRSKMHQGNALIASRSGIERGVA